MTKDSRWLIIFVIVLSVVITSCLLNAQHEVDTATRVENTLDIDNGDLKINWGNLPTTNITLTDSLTITKSGVYHLTGSLTNGTINIKTSAEDAVKLILDNVTISNSNGPAITCYSGDDLVIELVGTNLLTDGTTYSSTYDADVTGTIYSKSDLTFTGNGSLILTANHADGIVSKDDLTFRSGSYHIISQDDGIRGKDSVVIADGNFLINSTADAIKSTNETDQNKGFILIEAGNFSISAGDDGIHASRSLIINDGNIAIAKSYEGLESPIITINNGSIDLVAFDDGINAGSATDATANTHKTPFDADGNCILTINGGDIHVNASGDGIDSNGWLYLNGGKIAIDGPTNDGNGALDAGLGIVMNGGEVIALGSSGMAETLGQTSSVNNLSIYLNQTYPADTKVEIKASDGTTVISHTSAKSFNHLAIGTPSLKLGNTYTIYLNDDPYANLTISGTVTTSGNNSRPHAK